MATVAPTKGNLIKAQNGYKISTQGYDLLDRKCKLLTRELSALLQREELLNRELDQTLGAAYNALKEALITMGFEHVNTLAASIPERNDIEVQYYSVMGVEIPKLRCDVGIEAGTRPYTSLYKTNLSLDETRFYFNKVHELLISLAEVSSGIQHLTLNIRKTRIRANALKNIMIPRYTAMVAQITAALEEKEREDFLRLKVIKKRRL